MVQWFTTLCTVFVYVAITKDYSPVTSTGVCGKAVFCYNIWQEKPTGQSWHILLCYPHGAEQLQFLRSSVMIPYVCRAVDACQVRYTAALFDALARANVIKATCRRLHFCLWQAVCATNGSLTIQMFRDRAKNLWPCWKDLEDLFFIADFSYPMCICKACFSWTPIENSEVTLPLTGVALMTAPVRKQIQLQTKPKVIECLWQHYHYPHLSVLLILLPLVSNCDYRYSHLSVQLILLALCLKLRHILLQRMNPS